MFACGNLESGIQEILTVESGIVDFGIRNPTNDSNPESSSNDKDWNQVLGIRNTRCGDCLGFSYTQGAKKVIFKACHLGKLKLAYTIPNVISTSSKNIFS